MTKPRATWVLWLRLEDKKWFPAFGVTGIDPSFFGGKSLIEDFVKTTFPFKQYPDNDRRILPAGRKPK